MRHQVAGQALEVDLWDDVGEVEIVLLAVQGNVVLYPLTGEAQAEYEAWKERRSSD